MTRRWHDGVEGKFFGPMASIWHDDGEGKEPQGRGHDQGVHHQSSQAPPWLHF